MVSESHEGVANGAPLEDALTRYKNRPAVLSKGHGRGVKAEEKTPLIFGKMSAIMAAVGAVSKDRKNTQQGYAFRGIDDVYLALQSLMAKHEVFTTTRVISDRTEERVTKGGAALIYRVLKVAYTFYAVDGSFVRSVVIGEGMDSGDKASNKAMSVAHKYALLQAFCIPTEEPKDPENDSHEVRYESTGYDHADADMRASLRRLLVARKLPSAKYEAIGRAMQGKSSTDLDAVLKEMGL